MLSVLIPIYNFDCRVLVGDLCRQGMKLEVPWEILLVDDASDTHYRELNRVVANREGVHYEELSSNRGRAKIRNYLADRASYDNLLFLDSDSKVVRADYLAAYLEALRPGTVLCGGRVYGPRPQDRRYWFHWRYGVDREQKPAWQRRRHPYRSFMTNNFLIPRPVLLDIRFDERLSQYGHEDTLLGLELERHDIPIHHIDTPLEHIGLEPAPVFLEKSRRAIDNLLFLEKENTPIHTRLLERYRKMDRNWLFQPFFAALVPLLPLFEMQLRSSWPIMFFFDLYKLAYIRARDGEGGRS